MRKFQVFMAAALLAIPAAVSAQTGTATINARVYKALTVTPIAATIDLGIAIQGAGTVLQVLPTASGAAAFTIAGQENTAITLSEPASTTLSGPGGGTLTFNALWGNGDTSTQSAQTAGAVTGATLNASGNHYVWLGGSANTSLITAAQTGTYTGTITLTVSY